MRDITSQLDSSDLDNDTLFDVPSFTAHLYPTDCVNIASAMKTMITGFTDRPHIPESGAIVLSLLLGFVLISVTVKGRAAVSLANYDIGTLCAWYLAVRATYGGLFSIYRNR